MNDATRYPHSCKYCKYSSNISIRREVFCKYRGVQSSNGICGKYVFDPLKYKVKRKRYMDTSKYNKEDFSIE